MKFLASVVLFFAAGAAVGAVPVTVDNFTRAESDLFFSRIATFGGFGKFLSARNVTNVDFQPVVRMNRDTIYSAAVLDLDAGPATITLPDAGGRFVTLQIFDEDEYSQPVVYKAGSLTLTRDLVGTRYALAIVRILVNPLDAADLAAARAYQDAIQLQQANPGRFEIPAWDPVSQGRVRDSLFTLSGGIEDSRGMFGSRAQVDPVRHLIGTATGWGGNFETDALYLMRTVPQNDGAKIYHLRLGDVPVDGFWSISVYNARGYFEKNALGSYSLNSLTATRNADGSVDVQFGGCDGKIPNCLVTMAGWNYWVRLYRPHADVLNRSWQFPPVTE